MVDETVRGLGSVNKMGSKVRKILRRFPFFLMRDFSSVSQEIDLFQGK
jgi:hypothetical protein